MAVVTVPDTYCNFCGNEKVVATTNTGASICDLCTVRERLCEICGSVRAHATQSRQEQLHFDELCFK